MLDGIDTGYEGKFDFPLRRDRPGLAYLLASVPRTGSTYLSHLLWGTGCLGAPLEYLNFDPAGPYSFASRSPALQRDLWRSVLRRRTSPNGVFGLKAFPSQLEALAQADASLLAEVLALLSAGGKPRLLLLARRDRLAHAISYARASLSGQWRREQELEGGASDLPYSEEALRKARHGIDVQEAAWEEMFRDLRLEPLRLWYEDVVAAPGEAVRRVAGWLGVELDPNARIDVPPVLKQEQSGADRWRAVAAGDRA